MLMQLANIVGGALLIAPFVSAQLKIAAVGDAYNALEPYQPFVGVLLLLLGVVGLFERVSPLYLGLGGASFPQVVAALLAGVVLGAPLLERVPFLLPLGALLATYKIPLGFVALAIGLGSLLVGCVYPVCFSF